MERWKPVKGFTRYEVSDLGRVRNVITGELLRGSPDKKRYLVVRLYTGPTRRDFKDKKLHVLVALAFVPNPENKPQVDHVRGDKSDNRAIRLEWVTNAENMRRSWERGTHHATRGNTKLTPQQRTAIRACPDLTQRQLAKVFGVSQGTIFNVRNSSNS